MLTEYKYVLYLKLEDFLQHKPRDCHRLYQQQLTIKSNLSQRGRNKVEKENLR